MWCVADNDNDMCHTCVKRILNLNFNKAIINKISVLHQIAPNLSIIGD